MPRRKTSGQAPISAHPAFPVIVALWFAALLGLGSMVLPIALFERFSTASGLAEVYEAARPPLGVTARIAIALGASLAGALVGVMIARKVSAANAAPVVSRRAAAMRGVLAAPATAKRPISAHEEFGLGGIDAAGSDDPVEESAREPIAGRRRALSVTDESARSDFLDFAPLPGQGAAVSEEPLDLIDFEAPANVQATFVPAEEGVEDIVEDETANQPEPLFGTGSLSTPMPTPSPAEFAMTNSGPAPAPQFTRAPEPFAPPVDAAPIDDAPVAAAPVADERGFAGMGMVELVERFAQALERHRQAPATVAQALAEEPLLVFPSAPFLAPLSAEAPPVPTVPEALRPFPFAGPEAAEGVAPDVAEEPIEPVAQSAAPSPFAALALPDEDEEDEGDDEDFGYTSLLAMKNPAGLPRESVRIDDDGDEADEIEPVVVFPGQGTRSAVPAADGPSRDAMQASAVPSGLRPFDAPSDRMRQVVSGPMGQAPNTAPMRIADPAANERALREALEKLQRMSGAA